MPYGMLRQLAEEADEMRRHERLAWIEDMAVATGSLKKHEARRHIRHLSGPLRRAKVASAGDLRGLGIEVEAWPRA